MSRLLAVDDDLIVYQPYIMVNSNDSLFNISNDVLTETMFTKSMHYVTSFDDSLVSPFVNECTCKYGTNNFESYHLEYGTSTVLLKVQYLNRLCEKNLDQSAAKRVRLLTNADSVLQLNSCDNSFDFLRNKYKLLSNIGRDFEWLLDMTSSAFVVSALDFTIGMIGLTAIARLLHIEENVSESSIECYLQVLNDYYYSSGYDSLNVIRLRIPSRMGSQLRRDAIQVGSLLLIENIQIVACFPLDGLISDCFAIKQYTMQQYKLGTTEVNKKIEYYDCVIFKSSTAEEGNLSATSDQRTIKNLSNLTCFVSSNSLIDSLSARCLNHNVCSDISVISIGLVLELLDVDSLGTLDCTKNRFFLKVDLESYGPTLCYWQSNVDNALESKEFVNNTTFLSKFVFSVGKKYKLLLSKMNDLINFGLLNISSNYIYRIDIAANE